ncbi:AAA family ATPase [Streptomyces spongiae]|uniref:UDP-N-acetylglucosamine kinase n=1 Tax=Streptomyces spongiae TaxID=565072 RepID=A0A5N8XWC2_9ACTN|nr:AAA family ATPase [Streptomyces spongiae]
MLSEERHREILTTLILPASTGHAVAQEKPVAVLVAGQPGSGKSFLADVIEQSLNRRGGAVRISSDLYKLLHPSYGTLLAEDERTAGIKVRPDVRRWESEVMEDARAHGFDLVWETALAAPEEFRSIAGALRAAGYRVEVVVLATAEAWSQLSVLDRYVHQIHSASTGRYVSWENHDTCVRGMIRSLRVIEEERLADRVTVVRRGLEVLYVNELAEGSWIVPPVAADVVETERAAPWSALQTAVFRTQLSRTEERLYHRQVSAGQRLAVRGGVERAFALSERVRRIAQPLLEPPGTDYHRLSVEEHRWILNEVILPGLGEITPHKDPVVVFVVGQPGAGKSGTARLIRRALRKRRPVSLVGDDFKAAHPDYLKLLETCPRTASARIRADYQAWQDEADAYVIAGRGDAVIEMAPGSARQFLDRAARYRAAGYRVELVALAVRAADSRQGTADRYTEASRRGKPARFTTSAGHDVCFVAVTEVVRLAELGAAVDSLTVIRRDDSAVHRNKLGPDGRWVRPLGAVRALVDEQRRPYTPQEAARFLATQRRLRAALPQYRAELIQITQLARPLMPGHPRTGELVRPEPPTALPMPPAGPGATSPLPRPPGE